MSRGLGKMQREILRTLDDRGEWMWSLDLIAAIAPAGEGPIPCVFYSSAIRAARGLVRRSLLCSGFPEDRPPRFKERSKAAYWLPDQQAPAIRRTFPVGEVGRAIVAYLASATEPLSYADIACHVSHLLMRTRDQQLRLPVPFCRAMAHLVRGGVVNGTVGKCRGVTKICYSLTLNRESEVIG